MSGNNIGLINRLAKKNIKDTIILGIATIIITAIVIFVENKTVMVLSTIVVLFAYFAQYQISKNELLKSIDKLIDNELKEFQKISVKVLQLSEKERQSTYKYTEMLDDVVQTTKLFKSSTLKTKEKTQNLSSKVHITSEESENEIKLLSENINNPNIKT